MMDEREVLALNEDADYEALAVPRIAKFGGGALLFLGVMTLVLCLPRSVRELGARGP